MISQELLDCPACATLRGLAFRRHVLVAHPNLVAFSRLLTRIADSLAEYNRRRQAFLLFPHLNPDPDLE